MEKIGNQKMFEKKEQVSNRHIDIHMLRHGRQNEYADINSQLSPEGQEQARKFTLDFLKNYLGQAVIIKIKHSPVDRAAQTAAVIEKTINEEVEANQGSKDYADISLYNSRLTSELKTTGSLRPIMKSGVPYEEALDEWLANSDKYPEARKPEEIADKVRAMVNKSDKLIHHLSKEGPNIVYIWVTHETAHAAVAQKLIGGSSSEDIGGKIEHLEDMKISISNEAGSKPIVEFRERIFELDNQNEK